MFPAIEAKGQGGEQGYTEGNYEQRMLRNYYGVKIDTKNTFKTEKYKATMVPNGRLAGLVRKVKDEDGQPLVPFVFAEVSLPRARRGQTPTLHSKLPSNRWVFCWDERRRCGYLLATPRARDTKELRFRVEWPSARAAVGGGQ